MITGWFPADVSTFGGGVDSVFRLILYVVGFWFILAEALILWFAIRYRRKADRPAAHIRGETLRQAAWIFVPALIVMLLDFGIDAASARVWAAIKERVPPAAVNVRVTAERFAWFFTYPGPDGSFGTKDDLMAFNTLHVPVNAVVRLSLGSMDVIHSFAVPNLRLRQDVVPDRTIYAWFEATKPGSYEIECTELCGYDHYRMRGKLVVLSADDYARWMQKHWPLAGPAGSAKR